MIELVIAGTGIPLRTRVLLRTRVSVVPTGAKIDACVPDAAQHERIHGKCSVLGNLREVVRR